MARFTKNTIAQIGGFQDEVLAEEVLFGQTTYWDITVADETGESLDLTDWIFSGEIRMRLVTAIEETRNGLDVQGMTVIPTAPTINISSFITAYDPTKGKVRFTLDASIFSSTTSTLDSTAPPVYTGYIGFRTPSIGDSSEPTFVPSITKKILLLFIVRNDGVYL